jgi:hypothetical protein
MLQQIRIQLGSLDVYIWSDNRVKSGNMVQKVSIVLKQARDDQPMQSTQLHGQAQNTVQIKVNVSNYCPAFIAFCSVGGEPEKI